MKILSPILILGIAIFVTPFLHLPPNIEQWLVSAFGFVVFVLVFIYKVVEHEKTSKKDWQGNLFNQKTNLNDER